MSMMTAKMSLRTFTRLMPGLLLALTVSSAFVGCNSDRKKLEEKERELEELRQLAELDKREMENQYAEFAMQYNEMKMSVRDDSLLGRLDAEQRRADSLLRQLKQVKATSSAEILRLKKELATVREVLKYYIRQVDSLQQLNQTLASERDAARAEVARTRQENNSINEENASLSEKVAIAAQLNATGISVQPVKKNGKEARKSKDITRFVVSFTVTRNVTAATGNRTVYVRLMKPNQQVAGATGTFAYENRNLEYSAQKTIEYTGQEQRVTVYVPVKEFLGAGRYSAYIFVDGQMIGSGAVEMSK